MYVLLHGARKNLGDYLIGARCEALLRKHHPDHELIRLPSWQSLEPHRELLERADALIILGGPGYQSHFWPGVYPLTSSPKALPAPLIPMGLGWKGFPGDELTVRRHRFEPAAADLLRHTARQTPWMGCRDHFTRRVLNAEGIQNALMTGCPVWYHLPSLGKAPVLPRHVERVVFTPAQKPLYRDQSVDAAAVVAARFPDAERICSFHRGIDAHDPEIPPADRVNNRFLADAIGNLGFEVRDVSGDLDKIEFYEDCAVHVGYRVHAHIHFLSRRYPSVLLHEDGRGRGVDDALGLPGVPAYSRSLPGRFVGRVSELVAGRELKPRGAVVASTTAGEQLDQILRGEVHSGWARYAGLSAVIDAHYAVMTEFLESLQ